MAVTFSVVISGTIDQLLRDMIFRLEGGNVEGFLLRVMDPYVRERIRDRFASEGDDVTGRWAQLKPQTANMRRAGGYPPYHPINVRTQLMVDFLTQIPGWHGVGGGFGEAWMEWPGDFPDQEMIDKVRTAQSGKASPKTPARPVLGFNQKDNMFLASELVKYMMGI